MTEPGVAGTSQDLDEDDPGYRVPRWWGLTAFVLSVLGLADSVYLTIEHFQGSTPSCPATGVINCAKVTTSPESYVVHIPVAVLGLAFFAGMVVVNLPVLWRVGLRPLAWLRMAMVTVGLGMVVYLVSAEVFTIRAVCLWCTAVHVITVALFVLVLVTLPVLTSAATGTWVDDDQDDEGSAGPGADA